jgi:hypothetical protein
MEISGAPRTEHLERRRFGRLQGHFDVVFLSGNNAGDQISGKAINVSKEGAGVIFRSEVLPGTQISMTIYSKEDQSVCSEEVNWKKEVRGRMVHGVRITQWSYLDPSIEIQETLL